MMITRCPGCSTTFRVTPEQLKARHGQVRCGKCLATFNALDGLTEELPALVTSLGAIEPPDVVESAEPMPEILAGEPVAEPEQPIPAPEAILPDVAIPLQADVDEPGLEPVPEPTIGPAVEAAAIIEPTIEPPAEPISEALPATEPAWPPEPERSPTAEPEPRLHEPLTLGPRRWPWLVGSLAALLVLALQIVFHLRNEVAVGLPDTRPLLAAACEQLGCELTLPSHIEAIGIETSDLLPEKSSADRLQLVATLRNRAAHAQVWPQLELTLTDTADRALLRRVLTPSEYLPAGTSIPAGFPARSDQAVQLILQTTEVPAVGYRLYVFYP